MANKKGFTLVELIATILILAILITLGTVGYGQISKRIKETALNNKISRIEIAAANYASDTGYLTTNVNELMEKGYIPADLNDGTVENPLDKSRMNCHIVSITYENNNYYGKYSEDEECDLSNLDIVNIKLEIVKYEEQTKSQIAANEWTRSNIILSLKLKDASVNKNDIVRITWISNGGREEVIVNNDFDSKKEKLVSAEQIMNTPYSVEVLTQSGTIYQARTTVKIDKQRPVVFTDETEIENESNYVNQNKKVKVNASDRNGSGVYGYYIGTNNKCTEVSYEIGTSSYEKELDNGEYYICVRDNVGNVSEDTSTTKIEVSRVDKNPPKCEWTGEVATWSKGSRTITLKGVDTESGSNSIYTKTYESGTVGKDHLSYEISDIAGNKTICEKDVDVYIDNDAPECTWSGEDGSWTNQNRTITLKGTDSGSGSTSSNSWSYTTGTTSTASLSYTVSDKLGNSRVCNKTADVYVDKEAPNCNWSGSDNTTWTNQSRQISVSGVDVNNGSGSTSSYTWNYNSGTTSVANLSFNISDAAGNNKTCSKTASIYVDKEAPTCTITPSGTNYNGWYTSNVTFNLKVTENGSGENTGRRVYNGGTLTTDVTSHTVTAALYDNVGNSGSCSITIKRDAADPKITAKSGINTGAIYIREGQNITIDANARNYTSNPYYNLDLGLSSWGNVTCSYNNTNNIPLGANTVTCTATKGNGKTASLQLTFRHQYDASFDRYECSSGTVVGSSCRNTRGYDYYCPDNSWSLSGSTCSRTLTSGYSYSCNNGYEGPDNSNKCSKTTTQSASISCPDGWAIGSTNCYIYSAATANYSCPTGYIGPDSDYFCRKEKCPTDYIFDTDGQCFTTYQCYSWRLTCTDNIWKDTGTAETYNDAKNACSAKAQSLCSTKRGTCSVSGPTICKKYATKTADIKKATLSGYTCSSGTYKGASGCLNTVAFSYSCPYGYKGPDGSHNCSSTTTVDANKNCPTGYRNTGSQCVNDESQGASRTCSGWSDSGSGCFNDTPATAKYKCPSGGSLSGTTCSF